MSVFTSLRNFIFCILISVVGSAFAADSVVSGKVSQIDIVAGDGGAPNNYDLRVYLEGQATICSGAPNPNWNYINASDAGYKSVLAALLMAQATGKSVTLYANKRTGGNCQISYLVMLG